MGYDVSHALVLRRQGKSEQAEQMHRQGKSEQAEQMHRQGKSEQAEQMHRQGLENYEKVLGNVQVQFDLARSMVKNKSMARCQLVL
jgi:hypothetical protein